MKHPLEPVLSVPLPPSPALFLGTSTVRAGILHLWVHLHSTVRAGKLHSWLHIYS